MSDLDKTGSTEQDKPKDDAEGAGITPTDDKPTEDKGTAKPEDEAGKTPEGAKMDDEPLGEGGKKALEAERAAKDAAVAELAEFKSTAVAKADHDAVVTERDQLKTKVTELETSIRNRDAGEEVLAAATAAGARNAKAVARLADLSKYDAEKKNAADLVKTVSDELPDLFGEPETPAKPGLGTEGGEGNPKNKPRHITREQFSQMSNEEFEANRDAVYESMKSWT